MATDIDERRKKAFEEIVREFGSMTEMARRFGVSVPAIYKWKLNGIPRSRVPFFMLKYPELDAWKGLPRV